jgi:hypothetical protein
MEPAGTDGTIKVSGPNLGEAFLSIQRDEGRLWRAALRRAADGPELASTPAELETPTDAWEAAFELYRTHFIV